MMTASGRLTAHQWVAGGQRHQQIAVRHPPSSCAHLPGRLGLQNVCQKFQTGFARSISAACVLSCRVTTRPCPVPRPQQRTPLLLLGPLNNCSALVAPISPGGVTRRPSLCSARMRVLALITLALAASSAAARKVWATIPYTVQGSETVLGADGTRGKWELGSRVLSSKVMSDPRCGAQASEGLHARASAAARPPTVALPHAPPPPPTHTHIPITPAAGASASARPLASARWLRWRATPTWRYAQSTSTLTTAAR
jgi:hypothetical protein